MTLKLQARRFHEMLRRSCEDAEDRDRGGWTKEAAGKFRGEREPIEPCFFATEDTHRLSRNGSGFQCICETTRNYCNAESRCPASFSGPVLGSQLQTWNKRREARLQLPRESVFQNDEDICTTSAL